VTLYESVEVAILLLATHDSGVGVGASALLEALDSQRWDD